MIGHGLRVVDWLIDFLSSLQRLLVGYTYQYIYISIQRDLTFQLATCKWKRDRQSIPWSIHRNWKLTKAQFFCTYSLWKIHEKRSVLLSSHTSNSYLSMKIFLLFYLYELNVNSLYEFLKNTIRSCLTLYYISFFSSRLSSWNGWMNLTIFPVSCSDAPSFLLMKKGRKKENEIIHLFFFFFFFWGKKMIEHACIWAFFFSFGCFNPFAHCSSTLTGRLEEGETLTSKLTSKWIQRGKNPFAASLQGKTSSFNLANSKFPSPHVIDCSLRSPLQSIHHTL